MTYYCFLCNQIHNDSSTEEHFIPRSINGPEYQCLPVCKTSNTQSNSIFDSNVRDILYWTRFNNTKMLKRTGEALLSDGTVKQYKFAYDESQAFIKGNAFPYFFDRETNKQIPTNSVYAIKFLVGLNQKEKEVLIRGLAKISLGALTYLLEKEGIKTKKLINLFSQPQFNSLRVFALNLSSSRNSYYQKISMGRTDIINRLQKICKEPFMSNHVIEINFREKKSIRIEGMLYSMHGWQLIIPSDINFDFGMLYLENTISDLPAPKELIDKTFSPDSICIINPDYKGEEPIIPLSWRNR